MSDSARDMFIQGAIWATRIARGAAIAPEHLTPGERQALLSALETVMSAAASGAAGMPDIIAGRQQLIWPALTLPGIEKEFGLPAGILGKEGKW